MSRPGKLTLLLVAFFFMTDASEVQSAGRRMTFDEIMTAADRIFVGEVVAIRTRWGDTKKMIWTDYEFSVSQWIRGRSRRRTEIVSVAGGAHDGIEIRVTHTPSFSKGRTYLLFAAPSDRLYTSPLVGGDAGLYEVAFDASSGANVLIDSRGRALVLVAGQGPVSGPSTTPANVSGVVEIDWASILCEAPVAWIGEGTSSEPRFHAADGQVLPRPKSRPDRELMTDVCDSPADTWPLFDLASLIRRIPPTEVASENGGAR